MKEITQYLKKIGYSTCSYNMYEKIEEWLDWYKGKVESFHNYNVYNGNTYVECEILSLQIAKKICEDKADLLLNEKVKINVSDENTQEILDAILYDNNFYVCANNLIEITNALGTGAFVEYINENDIVIDYIKADMIFPLSYSNGKIIECAFASLKKIENEDYIYINLHVFDENKNYVVVNKLLKIEESCNNKNDYRLVEIDIDDGLVNEYYTNSDIPLFQIIKPNIVNNYDLYSPLGMSAFGNAIDIIKSIDTIYDSYINEFNLGKKRIFVDSNMVNVSITDGEIKQAFDSHDTVFYGVNMDDTNQSIKEIDMNLRVTEHSEALNDVLATLSHKVGLGYGYYSFEKNGLKTATEVISEQSQLYRNIKKDEIILNQALTELTQALLYLASTIGYSVDLATEIKVFFDDSIIEDTSEIRKNALLEYNSGLIDQVEYFKIVYNMTDSQAIDYTNNINSRKSDENMMVEED